MVGYINLVKDHFCAEVQIRLKLFYMGFMLLLHYKQRITQISFSSITNDTDYHNAVFVYISGEQITPELLCFFA